MITGSGFLNTKSLTVLFAVDGLPPINIPCAYVSNSTLVVTAPANPLVAQPGS